MSDNSDTRKKSKERKQNPRQPANRRNRHTQGDWEKAVRGFNDKMGRIVQAMKADKPMSSDDFNRLYISCHRFLLALAVALHKRCGVQNPRLEAEDALQQWHYKMMTVGYASYSPSRGTPFSYSYITLRNICKSIHRARTGLSLQVDQDLECRCNPLKPLIDTETKAILDKALERLPPHERIAIESRYHHNQSDGDLAAQSGTNPSTIAVQRHRGLRRLCDDLDRRKGDVWPCESP